MSTSISICAADEVDLAQAETPAEIFLNQSTANIESIYCSGKVTVITSTIDLLPI